MNVRHYQPGDEHAQLTIYNTVGAGLAKFKPATPVELQRRIHARDFDPTMRWYAIDQGKTVGYSTFQANGRLSYPWCLPGHEHVAEPLFNQVLQAMKQRGMRKAFAAYRGDWPAVNNFFRSHGFVHVRDMVNFVLPFENMPTPSARMTRLGAATEDDVPKILALAPSVFRVTTAEELRQALWNNPFFSPPESLFVVRSKADGSPIAAGVFITTSTYADPRALDASMPCYRLGAFGTEGMTTKRVRGLFSFVAALDKNLFGLGMDLLAHATCRLENDDDISCFAAQVASDVPLLLEFYQRTFERQGSFPVFERDLTK